MPRTLTALAPICRGEEESLRAILRLIGDDIRGSRLETRAANPRIEFLRSRRISFRTPRHSPHQIADRIANACFIPPTTTANSTATSRS
jgi:hypothetical protein